MSGPPPEAGRTREGAGDTGGHTAARPSSDLGEQVGLREESRDFYTGDIVILCHKTNCKLITLTSARHHLPQSTQMEQLRSNSLSLCWSVTSNLIMDSEKLFFCNLVL